MRRFPEPIQTLVTEFTRLPGVGPKTALRYVYALLKWTPDQRTYFSRSIANFGAAIHVCPTCFSYTETVTCEICVDVRRDETILCVVAESRDVSTIEATGNFHGRYHVLGGVLNPVEGITAEKLHIQELVNRLLTHPEIQEIILALSPDIAGEMTIGHLANVLRPLGRRLTRLARGLPMGADLEYADEVTLGDAITGRQQT